MAIEGNIIVRQRENNVVAISMRILVSGASGQLARSLNEAASGKSLTFQSLGRPEFDITDGSAIRNTIREYHPDVLINAAAYTAVDRAESEREEAFRLNAIAPGVLAREAEKIGAAIIHVSTDYVFDGQKSEAYTEADPVGPINLYGESKLGGELAVARENSNHVIVRTAWVHSPFAANFVKTMLRLASERDVVSVVDDTRGTPTYAPDLAAALLDIAGQIHARAGDHLSGTYHLASPDIASWADVAEALFEVSRKLGGPVAQVQRIKTSDYPTPARRPVNSVLDSAKAFTTFGTRLPAWRDGIARCVGRLLAG